MGNAPASVSPARPGVVRPAIHVDIIGIVFLGGTIGTALRYAFARIPSAGAFHTGTLVANLIACLCYAGLSSFLAGCAWFDPRQSSPSASADRGVAAREYASRGLGMGLCGGLSTMSTLALECFDAIRGGSAAAGIAYLLVTFALGLACAALGAWLGRGTKARGPRPADAADDATDGEARR